MVSRPPFAVWLLRLFAVLLAAGLLLAFAPAGWLRGRLASLAPDGEVELLTAELLRRLRFAAAAGLLAPAFLLWASWRRRPAIENAAARLAAASSRLSRSLGRDLRRLAGWRPALAICLLGFLVRLVYLGAPMRHDEAKTFFAFVARPLSDAISNYYVPNNHILHTLLAHLSWRLFGDAPEVLRLPAFLAGCGLVPLTFLAGLRLFERRSATWAAALVALCPPLIDYSTDARGYTLVAAAALASFWILTGRDRQPLAWAATAVLGALGLFAVPVMAFPLGALLLHRCLAAPPARRARNLGYAAATAAACLALATLLYLPAVARSGARQVIGHPYLKPLPALEVLSGLPELIAVQAHFLVAGVPKAAVFLLPLGALLFPAPRQFRRSRRLLAAVFLAAFALTLAQRVLPLERTYLALAPLVLLAAARAGSELTLLLGSPRRPWLAPAAAFVLAAALLTFRPDANRECPEADFLAQVIVGRRVEGAQVLTGTPVAGPLRFYLTRRRFSGPLLWARQPPEPPPPGPLFLAIRPGSFTAAELGVTDLEDFRLIATGPTALLYLRRGPLPAASAAASDVSFAPP